MGFKLEDIKAEEAFDRDVIVPNIYQRMLNIQTELGVVAKNIEIQATKTSGYKAVSERDVLDAVKPLEAKHGVFSYPAHRSIVNEETLETERTFNGQTSVTRSKFIRVRTVYRFVNVEDPEDFIEIVSYGDGIDTGDKAPPKAMTFADKNAILKAYKISTGDDPDEIKSPDNGYTVSEQMATDKQMEIIRDLSKKDPERAKEVKARHPKALKDTTLKEASEIIGELKRER